MTISEGVGEMVEGLSLPAERRSEIGLCPVSSSPSRGVVASVKLTPPSRRRPLVFTGAGQPREIIATLPTSAGPCDLASDFRETEDQRRHQLLLLPGRLLRRFLRLSFRFSLLRHCCPPSLSGWRYRCSAVANRSALHSDYYSEKKITVTPLNFVCKPRAPLLHATHNARCDSNKHQARLFARARACDFFAM